MEHAYKYGWWLPPDLSVHGPRVDLLINWLHVFMAVLFCGWAVFMIYSLIRFRARPGVPADYHGARTHVSSWLEAGVAIIEVIFLVGLSIPVWATVKANPPSPDQADVVIRVVAEQFAWNIHYPGPDGKFGKTDAGLVDQSNPLGLVPGDPDGKDDITTINQMHFPVGKKILVNLSSKDVIHSFALPVMRIKQDAIPGMTIPVWFEGTGTGHFEIACAQLCGLGHYRMKGFFSIDTPEEYAKWLKEQAAAGSTADDYY